VTQEAMAQAHADGNRLLLAVTFHVAAVVLALLGEAEPAAVLSGAGPPIATMTARQPG
jgi:hypothetical protein